jgi:hypothetical protein
MESQAIVNGKAKADRSAYTGNFFDNDGIADRVHIRTAKSLGRLQAEEVERSHFLHHFPGETRVPINVPGYGSDLRFCKQAHRLAERFVFHGRIKIQRSKLQ